MLIPLHGPDGSNGHYAIKSDHPRIRDGRPVKYDYPAGAKPIIDVPLRCIEQLGDPTVPIFFHRGCQKKRLPGGLSYCAVDLWGVHNWYTNPEHGGFATIEPLPDWDPIVATLDGRECYLVF